MGVDTELMRVAYHKVEACDEVMAKNVAEDLHAHYPGHMWAVHVDSEGGVVNIFNLRISGQWGMRLFYRDLALYDSEAKRKVLMAGGELLERAKMVRGRATGELAYEVEGAKNRRIAGIG
jgi:hypothetical protein